MKSLRPSWMQVVCTNGRSVLATAMDGRRDKSRERTNNQAKIKRNSQSCSTTTTPLCEPMHNKYRRGVSGAESICKFFSWMVHSPIKSDSMCPVQVQGRPRTEHTERERERDDHFVHTSVPSRTLPDWYLVRIRRLCILPYCHTRTHRRPYIDASS